MALGRRILALQALGIFTNHVVCLVVRQCEACSGLAFWILVLWVVLRSTDKLKCLDDFNVGGIIGEEREATDS